jgi:hypothetical protein
MGIASAFARCATADEVAAPIPRYSLGRTVKFILALIALARTADDRTITVCHNDSNSLMILVASFTPKADDA